MKRILADNWILIVGACIVIWFAIREIRRENSELRRIRESRNDWNASK